MDFASVMQNLLGGQNDLLTGERWREGRPPLTPAQRQLWRALESNDEVKVGRLLAAHPDVDVNFLSDDGGFSCLHLACMRDQARIAQLLLDAGAAIDQRAPTTRETPLLVAACHGCADAIQVLLDRGADPHCVDWGGKDALVRTAEKAGMGDRWARAHRLIQAAVSTSTPLSRAAKKAGGCGGCGRAEGKLSVCARCALRSYCSRECQAKDFPAHKQRCKVVGEFRQQLQALCDPSSSMEARRHLVKRLEHDAAARRLMVDVKGVKQLLEALPSDVPVVLPCLYGPRPQETRLLVLCALSCGMIEREGSMELPPHEKMTFTFKDAGQQFATAGGMEVVLTRILQADCPQEDRINGMRMVSGHCQAHQEQVLPQQVVRKGRAPAAVKLLSRLIAEHRGVNAIFANACVCLAALALQEGPSFEQLTRQAAAGFAPSSSSTPGSRRSSNSAGQQQPPQQQQQQQADEPEGLLPVAAAIFEHVDLRSVSRQLYSSDGVAQAAPELLLVLSRSKPAFELLMADPLIRQQLLGAFYADLFMAPPTAYGPALEFWQLAHMHRPGVLVEHWESLQGVLAVACGPQVAAESPPFVMTLLDPLIPHQSVDRAQQGVFVSDRHALKAARLLANVAADLHLPGALFDQFVDWANEVMDAKEACQDAEAALVLHDALVGMAPRVEKELVRRINSRDKKKKKKEGRGG